MPCCFILSVIDSCISIIQWFQITIAQNYQNKHSPPTKAIKNSFFGNNYNFENTLKTNEDKLS